MRTFTFQSGTRMGSAKGIAPTEAQRNAAYLELDRMVQAGTNKTKAVEYLLGLGWSVTAICGTIAYESDTAGHRAGDPIRAQHVNHIKDKWLAAGNKIGQNAKPETVEAQKPTPTEPPKPVAPAAGPTLVKS